MTQHLARLAHNTAGEEGRIARKSREHPLIITDSIFYVTNNNICMIN